MEKWSCMGFKGTLNGIEWEYHRTIKHDSSGNPRTKWLNEFSWGKSSKQMGDFATSHV